MFLVQLINCQRNKIISSIGAFLHWLFDKVNGIRHTFDGINLIWFINTNLIKYQRDLAVDY